MITEDESKLYDEAVILLLKDIPNYLHQNSSDIDYGEIVEFASNSAHKIILIRREKFSKL